MVNKNAMLAGLFGYGLLAAVGCERDAPEPQVSSESTVATVDESAAIAVDELTPLATAVMHPTDGNEAQGNVVFYESPSGQGANVDVNMMDVPPGPHGLHIHETGDCGASDASSAGGHFNPNGSVHGGRNAPESHLGDMGNVVASEDNLVEVEFYMENFQFSGPESIAGKAVVMHSGEDDLESDPDGASGNPIACGVIRLNLPTAQDVFESVP